MDILQRAADMLDRAQDRMAGATNQAARTVLTSAQIRAMEARQVELRQRLEQATMDLGRLTFQRWKNRGVGNEQSMTALCQHIDLLNSEYQQLVADIADARAATTPYPSYPSYPSYPPYIPPGYASPSSQAMPSSPRLAPAPPQIAPPAAAPYNHSYSPVGPAAAPPSYPVASPYSLSYPPNGADTLPSSATAGPPKPSRECPECYTMVPGTTKYCPSCGMRV